MSIKEQTIELDVRAESVDLMSEMEEQEWNIVTAVKDAIDVPAEMGDDDIHQSNVVIPFGQRQRRKKIVEPENSRVETVKKVEKTEKAFAKVCNSQDHNVILPFEKKGEYFVEPLGAIAPKTAYNVTKRIFDIFTSAVALIALAIPMAIIAVMIKIKSPGPVFYHQERLGLCGKNIDVVKFRTMDIDAEASGAQWSQGDDDPRIFPFGRTLRKTRLDELPQLVAVLTGKMSIIGPRPEREIFYNEFETYVHGFHERLKVKPGLTGLAQVNGGYDLKPEEKIMWDIEYIKKRSLWLDAKILCMTVKTVLTGRGAK